MSKVIGVDTNCLVAMAIASHPLHEFAHQTWRREVQADGKFGITPLVMAEFLHIVTDSRRFPVACSFSQALDLSEAWWSAAEVERLFPNDASIRLAHQWMRQHQLGRKRVLDTQLAATFFVHGVTRILTSNPGDFAVFGVFDMLSASTGASPADAADSKE